MFPLDITGEKRGRLIARCRVDEPPGQDKSLKWMFDCSCGGTIVDTVSRFRIGYTRSCGCIASSFYSWTAMMNRCYNPNHNRYANYGRRGIKVCERWHTFENFNQDMGERPLRFTLGRKRADEDYTPGNCFWEHATKNNPDTDRHGRPTRPGRLKYAKRRDKKG